VLASLVGMHGQHSSVCCVIESTIVELLFARPGNTPEQKKRWSNEKAQTTISHEQQHKTNNNKQQQQNNNGKLFSFWFTYLCRETLMIVSLHSIIGIKVSYDFCNCWLFLPNSPSSNTKICETTRRCNNTKKTTKTAKDGKLNPFFLLYLSKLKLTHSLVCGSKRKRYVPLFLLLIVVSLSHVVSKPPKSPINTTRHHKTQKTTKQR